MSVIQGEQGIQRLAAIMRQKDNPDDPGLLGEASAALDDVFAAIRSHVERTGKACKGSVTITLDLKGYRSKGGEVAVDLTGGVTPKAPPPPKRETILFLDHEGAAHTTPQQEEMPLFGKDSAKVVDGGKDQGKAKDKPQREKASV